MSVAHRASRDGGSQVSVARSFLCLLALLVDLALLAASAVLACFALFDVLARVACFACVL